MFTHLVILKVEPFFLYAEGEKDALAICDRYKDNVAGVVIGENLFVKEPTVKFSFEQHVTHQISYESKVTKIEEEFKDEDLQMDIITISDELEEEFEKLQSSITG